MDKKYSAKMRHEALAECLEIIEAQRRNFSKGSGVTPKEGYEMAWARENTNRLVVQEMMREYRTDMEKEDKARG